MFIKGKESYGLEISTDPTLTTLNHYKKGKNKQLKDPNRTDRVLIVTKVRENKKIHFDLTKADVYLSKRNKITKKTKEIENKSESYIKSRLNLTFSVKDNYPALKGTLTLPNSKQVKASVLSDIAFETPLKKVLDSETIEKQLLKIGNYPFKVEHININYKNNLFLPVREINQLRRDLLTALENKVYSLYENPEFKLEYKNKVNSHTTNNLITFSYYTNNLEHLRN